MRASPSRPALVLVLVTVVTAGCTKANRAQPSPPSVAAARWQGTLGADHPLAGVILDIAAQRRVSEAELTARVAAADIVLVGETHDNPDHHRLEASLLRAFASAHPAPAVVFEMLNREQQPDIDASLAAHAGDADALARAVAWESSGWPAWSMYRPVFAAALASRGPILAAGLDRSAAMRIAHEGVSAVDPVLVPTFGLAAPLAADVQASLRHEMSEAHCGMLPDSMLDSMVLVQRARDASMAERLHEGSQVRHAALLIAGAGHVRRDRGVPAQLTRAYGVTSIAVGLVQVSDLDASPESYAAEFESPVLPFDFVWFTPRGSDVDHCAELRAHPRVR